MTLFPRKKRYSKISYEKRIELIKLVEEEGMLISKAAKRLKIKLPTAKVILVNYRKEGHIFHRRGEEVKSQEQREPKVEEEIIEDGQQPQQGSSSSSQPVIWFYAYYCPQYCGLS